MLKGVINKLSKPQKIICLIILLSFLILFTISIPTFSRFKNRSTIVQETVWDGSIANKYKSGTGTVNDPYIISNGSELAYFELQLNSNSYENTYFELSNDIILNDGVFDYDEDNILYILDSVTYYVDFYTNKYYDNSVFSGTEIGTVNIFNSLDNFKGNFKGNSFIIYGLYITDEESDKLGLFTNLEGNINDLYVENAMIYGGIISGGMSSDAINSSFKNILFDGFVVNRSTNLTIEESININISNVELENFEKTDYISLANNIPFSGATIISSSITGSYQISDLNGATGWAKINGTTLSGGTFDISLGTSILDQIPLVTYTDSIEEIVISFSNVKYNIEYEYAVSGGLIGFSNNNSIENCINKGNIYGNTNSGGLVGVTNSGLDVIRSYNNGEIDGVISGGIIGNIEKSGYEVNLVETYNTSSISGTVFAGLIGNIENNTEDINITSSFNTIGYSIYNIINSTVNIVDSYYVINAVFSGSTTGSFSSTTLSNLETEAYVVSNLGFDEFVDFSDILINESNVWVFELDSIPVLFLDDSINPIVSISTNMFSWNNLSYNLNTLKSKTGESFTINELDVYRPLQSISYYIEESDVPLTKSEIEAISTWSAYSIPVNISTEGVYIIYVKVSDYSNNIYYINSDILILDFSESIGELTFDTYEWNEYISEFNNIYLYEDSDFYVNVFENLLDITSTKYYISNEMLTIDQLNRIEDINWNVYSEKIELNENGSYIIYVKFVDEYNYTHYINSDYIIYEGYVSSFNIGRNSSSYLNLDPYVTNKSTVTLNFSYSNTYYSDLVGYTHNLMSNILLPINTNIKLIDNINEKVYIYNIETESDIFNYNDSCGSDPECEKVATYPFTLFEEIGTDVSTVFVEDSYYTNNLVEEDFTIVIDFSSTSFTTNHTDVKVYLETVKSSEKERTTLDITTFNIYSLIESENTNGVLDLSTTFEDEIYFNSNSSNDINIISKIDYKLLNNIEIIDTTFEDMNMGLLIKVLDSTQQVVSSTDLTSLIFKSNNKIYSFLSDNTIRINLSSAIVDKEEVLTIITHESELLSLGDYTISISNYVSYDGIYYDNIGDSISISLNAEDYSLIDYSFDVLMDDLNRIISKSESVVNVEFSILQNGALSDAEITVELYKKDVLSPYNQDYTSVNLQSYVNDTLTLKSGNIYYVSTSPVVYNDVTKLYNMFDLDLATSNFDNTSYKFVFSLNDGNKKIGTIEKYFIVR